MKHNLLKLLEEISEYPHDLSARTYLKNLIEELHQLFSNRPRWIVEENSKAVDIPGALAELQRWCDRAETEILGEPQQ